MNKISSLVLSLVFCTGIAYSQDFQHGFGIGHATTFNLRDKEAAYLTIHYSPRLALSTNEAYTLSLDLPLGFGIAGGFSYSNNLGTNNSMQYFVQAPLLLSYNRGAGQPGSPSSRFGFFGGAGFALLQGSLVEEIVKSDEYGNFYYANRRTGYSSIGPGTRLGVRCRVGNRQATLELSGMYLHGLTSQQPRFLGFSFLYNPR